MRLELGADDFALAVSEELQPSLGHGRRIELLERPGGGVARVGKGFVACCKESCVDASKLGIGHKDFAAGLRAPQGAGSASVVASRKGIERIVRMFCVTSSPLAPSPRVVASTSCPFS